MKYSEAEQGRVFILRLEDGDVLHETIETFAAEHGIRAAALAAVGGADAGSTLVVGPETDRGDPVVPMEHVLDHAHELAGVGTLFPGPDGEPVVHMHAACGRGERSVTGCVRRGVKTWHVLEVIIRELTGTGARRAPDPELGFNLLQP
jgi:predicted DNA-binding protein with PD1-like motif